MATAATTMEEGVSLIEIPFERLSATALHGLIEDFVTRDGTDYGAVEVAHETKMAQVLTQIQNRVLVILYDPESQTCGIVNVSERQNFLRDESCQERSWP